LLSRTGLICGKRQTHAPLQPFIGAVASGRGLNLESILPLLDAGATVNYIHPIVWREIVAVGIPVVMLAGTLRNGIVHCSLYPKRFSGHGLNVLFGFGFNTFVQQS
jgi:hypothetical protein